MMSIPLKGFTNRMGFIYTSLVMDICLYSLSAQLLQSNVEIVGGAVLQHIQTQSLHSESTWRTRKCKHFSASSKCGVSCDKCISGG